MQEDFYHHLCYPICFEDVAYMFLDLQCQILVDDAAINVLITHGERKRESVREREGERYVELKKVYTVINKYPYVTDAPLPAVTFWLSRPLYLLYQNVKTNNYQFILAQFYINYFIHRERNTIN